MVPIRRVLVGEVICRGSLYETSERVRVIAPLIFQIPDG